VEPVNSCHCFASFASVCRDHPSALVSQLIWCVQGNRNQQISAKMNARGLAQEAVSWYLSHSDPYAPHSENVQRFLSGPVQAVTLSILQEGQGPSAAADDDDGVLKIDFAENGTSQLKLPEEEKKSAGTWRDYLHAGKTLDSFPEWGEPEQKTFDALGKRTKARFEAFLAGVTLAVASEHTMSSSSSVSVHSNTTAASRKENRLPPRPSASRRTSGSEGSTYSFSLVEGLAGFHSMEKKNSPLSSPVISSLNLMRSMSSQSSPKSRCPQILEEELVTRLELYIRSLHRVRAQKQECVLAAEPARAIKARARSLVVSFVDTVGTVRQQSPVLTRLLQCLTQELLAVDVLGENVVRVIRRIVSEYEHQTSFASLAFLSSPEKSADQGLTPLVLKYLRYLQRNWKLCESECELERMLSRSVDPPVRHLFKTIEFRSIGHLLEVCQGFRSNLQHIEMPPSLHGDDDDRYNVDNADALKQAIRDLRREVITVNGQSLPPVTSRKELIHLLSQTLNSRTLTSGQKRRPRKGAIPRVESAPNLSSPCPSSQSESEDGLSSGNEADISVMSAHLPGGSLSGSQRAARYRRRSSFRLSTIDLLTRRVLLAAGRTGTGGDAYFVVRDLFGGDGVEVVPSQALPMHMQAARPGTIEIIVRLSSVTIKCHGSFDVYPKSLVGDCEPLIQVHTSMTETIALQEVRKSDSASEDGGIDDELTSDGDEDQKPPVMVLQERKTDRTGWRTLSIRPALYERVEQWNTPS
jgi:hypothetical protein